MRLRPAEHRRELLGPLKSFRRSVSGSRESLLSYVCARQHIKTLLFQLCLSRLDTQEKWHHAGRSELAEALFLISDRISGT